MDHERGFAEPPGVEASPDHTVKGERPGRGWAQEGVEISEQERRPVDRGVGVLDPLVAVTRQHQLDRRAMEQRHRHRDDDCRQHRLGDYAASFAIFRGVEGVAHPIILTRWISTLVSLATTLCWSNEEPEALSNTRK